MKTIKQELFGLLSLLAIFNISAQEITPDMFSQPANTGANMTIGVNASGLDQFDGGQIGAFYDIDGDAIPECVGLESISQGFFGLALWGDDSSTADVDGIPCGEWPMFYVLHNNNVITIEPEIQFWNDGWDENETCFDHHDYSFVNGEVIQEAVYCQYTGYCTNDIVSIVGVSLNSFGCTDNSACNYDMNAEYDDGTCEYAELGYNCDGCPENLPCACWCDGFGEVICLGVECTVCEDESACNYGEVSYDGDFGFNGVCVYPEWGYDCDGNCVSDSDEDGVCDEYEVYGCTDPNYEEYYPEATEDDGSCIMPYGCSIEIICCGWPDVFNTCPDSVEFDIIPACYVIDCPPAPTGCLDETACNYNPYVWEDDGSCFFPEVGFDCFGECLSGDDDNDGLCNEFEISAELINHPLFLPSGWSMFGFTCYNSVNVAEALQPIIQDVIIVKDYTGSAYLANWNYNGIGDFIYSYGYQIKLENTINNFQFCPTIILTE